MEKTSTQFKLVIPAILKQRLDDAAASSRRSLSAEIIMRLEETFDHEDKVNSSFFGENTVDIDSKNSLEAREHLDLREGAPQFNRDGIRMLIEDIKHYRSELIAMHNELAQQLSKTRKYSDTTDQNGE